MQLQTKKQYMKGTLVKYKKKKYKVLASIDCKWMFGLSNYLTVLEEL